MCSKSRMPLATKDSVERKHILIVIGIDGIAVIKGKLNVALNILLLNAIATTIDILIRFLAVVIIVVQPESASTQRGCRRGRARACGRGVEGLWAKIPRVALKAAGVWQRAVVVIVIGWDTGSTLFVDAAGKSKVCKDILRGASVIVLVDKDILWLDIEMDNATSVHAVED
jgi:hypothetical protein